MKAVSRHPTELELAPEPVRRLLRARAERLKAKPQAEGTTSQIWYAEFPVGEEQFALPLESLRAALPLRLVTPVPLSIPEVIGVVRYQGQIISALSLGTLLGGRSWAQDPSVLLVVDAGQGALVGLDCEQIPRPVAYPADRVDQARQRLTGALADLTTADLRQVQLIELAQLVQPAHRPHDHGT